MRIMIKKNVKAGRFLMAISAAAIVFAGCQETGAIMPNDPYFFQCYNQETNTAKNCEDTDFIKLLESKKEWKINYYRFKGNMIAVKQNRENPFVLRFKNNEINGTFGCNQFFGSYVIKDNEFHPNNIGMTRKMCEPKVMEHEDIMVQNFLNVSTRILVMEDAQRMSKIFFIGKDFYLVLD